MKGWKNTAFGQRYSHYFNDSNYRPLCKTSAMFTTAQPKSKPKGWAVCKRCLELKNKQDKRK